MPMIVPELIYPVLKADTSWPYGKRIMFLFGLISRIVPVQSATWLAILVVVASLTGFPNPAYAGFRTNIELPSPISQDTDLLERYWKWLIRQTQAPADLPLPEISVEEMPRNIRMQLLHPTRRDRLQSWRIAISPHSLQRAREGEELVVLSEVGHELVHHILLLKEHEWQFGRNYFNQPEHHHCDTEFQYLVTGVGHIIWSAYHSANLVRSVDQMNRRACWENGEVLAESSSESDSNSEFNTELKTESD